MSKFKTKRTNWDQHREVRIGRLYDITDRCLELHCKKRPELVKLIPELEEVRHGTEALSAEVHPNPWAVDSFH